MSLTLPDRIYAQYRDKPKAVAWYGITRALGAQIGDTARTVRVMYDIDKAQGEELDIIGRIVGVGREFESFVKFNPDTYFGASEAQFGSVDSQFETEGDVLSQHLSDAIYKVLIRAKIVRNNSHATLDDIITGVTFITGVAPVRVIDNEDMSFSVSIGGSLDDVARFVLNTFDVVPRPQGVKFVGYTDEPAVTQFGGPIGFGDTRAQFGLYFGA